MPRSRSIPTRLTFAAALIATAGFALISSTGRADAAEPIKIGAVLPFSGGVELYGAQAKLGLDLAAADINAAGGILGRPVEIVYRDDGTRPNIATEAARKVVEDVRGGRDRIGAQEKRQLRLDARRDRSTWSQASSSRR